MSDNSEFELLRDIAKLLKKYGPDTFERLSEKLSSPDFSERLAALLVTTAKTGRTAQITEPHKVERQQTQRDFRSSLIALEQTDPNRATLLIKFYDGLTGKTYLPTLRDIQAFVSDLGLPPLKATSRDKAIVPLIKVLLPLGLEDLQSRLSAVKPVPTNDDRSLEGWSNIILDKERRTK